MTRTDQLGSGNACDTTFTILIMTQLTCVVPFQSYDMRLRVRFVVKLLHYAPSAIPVAMIQMPGSVVTPQVEKRSGSACYDELRMCRAEVKVKSTSKGWPSVPVHEAEARVRRDDRRRQSFAFDLRSRR